MKPLKCYLGLVLFVGLLSQALGQATGVCNYTTVSSPGGNYCNNIPWVLVFEDDFDGNDLDRSKWLPITGVPRDMGDAPMWYAENNISVSNGVCRIQTNYDVQTRTFVSNWNPIQYTTRTFHYTSGEMNSVYNFGEGRFVGMVKVPGNNTSAWPAFWAYGQVGSMQGEIDIFEYWFNYYIMRTNLHKGPSNCAVNVGNWVNTAAAWREYTLDWERHHISWIRNDLGLVRWTPRWSTILGQIIPCQNIPSGLKNLNLDFPSINNEQVQVPMKIILNNAMRTNELNALDFSNLPIAMEIDYVRYYKRLPCLGNPSFVSTSSFFNGNGEYNILTASTFNFNSGSGLITATQLDAMASQSIVMNPGFYVDLGAVFVGRIGPSNCGVPGSGFLEDKYVVDDSYVLPTESVFGEGHVMHSDIGLDVNSNESLKQYSIENGRLMINGVSDGVLEVSDISGKQLVSQQIKRAEYFEVDLANYGPGILMVTFTSKYGAIHFADRVVLVH